MVLVLLQASPVNLIVGSHVWVEDPVLAWIDGEVTQINGQDVHVHTTNGKKVSAALFIAKLFHCSLLLWWWLKWCAEMKVLICDNLLLVDVKNLGVSCLMLEQYILCLLYDHAVFLDLQFFFF